MKNVFFPMTSACFRSSIMLYWIEWVVLIWVSGRLLSELTVRSSYKGLGGISKLSILILNLARCRKLDVCEKKSPENKRCHFRLQW